jgi:hypothetical protein
LLTMCRLSFIADDLSFPFAFFFFCGGSLDWGKFTGDFRDRRATDLRHKVIASEERIGVAERSHAGDRVRDAFRRVGATASAAPSGLNPVTLFNRTKFGAHLFFFFFFFFFLFFFTIFFFFFFFFFPCLLFRDIFKRMRAPGPQQRGRGDSGIDGPETGDDIHSSDDDDDEDDESDNDASSDVARDTADTATADNHTAARGTVQDGEGDSEEEDEHRDEAGP